MRLTIPMNVVLEVPHCLAVQCAAFGHDLAVAQMSDEVCAEFTSESLSLPDAVATLLAPELAVVPVPGASVTAWCIGVSDPRDATDAANEEPGDSQARNLRFEVDISVTMAVVDGLAAQLAFFAAALERGISHPEMLVDSLFAEDETITAMSVLGLVRPELVTARIPGARVVSHSVDLPTIEDLEDNERW